MISAKGKQPGQHPPEVFQIRWFGWGVDLWHNSEFDLDVDVTNIPLGKGVTYYRIH